MPVNNRRNASRLALRHTPSCCLPSSLLRDSCHLIEESDQVLPNQVINNQHHRKDNRYVRVVHVYDAKVEEAVVCRLQETQGTPEKKSERGEDERKDCAVNPQRQVCA